MRSGRCDTGQPVRESVDACSDARYTPVGSPPPSVEPALPASPSSLSQFLSIFNQSTEHTHREKRLIFSNCAWISEANETIPEMRRTPPHPIRGTRLQGRDRPHIVRKLLGYEVWYSPRALLHVSASKWKETDWKCGTILQITAIFDKNYNMSLGRAEHFFKLFVCSFVCWRISNKNPILMVHSGSISYQVPQVFYNMILSSILIWLHW